MRTSNVERRTSNVHVKSWKVAVLVMVSGNLMLGCRSNSAILQPVSFDRTPPAVRAGFLAYFSSAASIQKIEREQVGDQDYYTFTFVDKDHNSRVVELNEGGDQVQER